jgi:hypothetical protein
LLQDFVFGYCCKCDYEIGFVFGVAGQQVGLLQSSQFSSANSAGQSLQGTQQAIGTMGSSNIASQLMTTNGALYPQQLQLSQQALLNNQQV